MMNWIDGSITPGLIHTNIRCVIMMRNNDFHLGIYSFSEGWYDITDKCEIVKEQIQCYLPLFKPTKKINVTESIKWE